LVALFGILAVVAAIALLVSSGRSLTFSQRMSLDLQDGNLAGFATRLATYIVLLVIGYLLGRTIRSVSAAWRARSFQPFNESRSDCDNRG
jgi:hypothetical protein